MLSKDLLGIRILVMKKNIKKFRRILYLISNVEKRHKIITYCTLILLTALGYLLRNENKNVNVKSAILVESNLYLKEQMLLFNRSYENLPLPVWQKVKRGKYFIMQYVNPEYVKRFGHLFNYDPLAQIGKNNFELFPKKVAQEFYENDITVAITGEKLEVVGSIIGKDGKPLLGRTIKWREIRDNKDTLIYGMVKEILSNNNIK